MSIKKKKAITSNQTIVILHKKRNDIWRIVTKDGIEVDSLIIVGNIAYKQKWFSSWAYVCRYLSKI